MWGRWKTGRAEEDVVGKRVAGLPFFNGEDACQPYEKGHPIGMGVYVDDTHRGGGRGRQRLIPRRR